MRKTEREQHWYHVHILEAWIMLQGLKDSSIGFLGTLSHISCFEILFYVFTLTRTMRNFYIYSFFFFSLPPLFTFSWFVDTEDPTERDNLCGGLCYYHSLILLTPHFIVPTISEKLSEIFN